MHSDYNLTPYPSIIMVSLYSFRILIFFYDIFQLRETNEALGKSSRVLSGMMRRWVVDMMSG